MVKDIFDIEIRSDAMRTLSIRSRVGVMTKRGGGKSSVVLMMERGLRRRGKRRNSVALSGHADR